MFVALSALLLATNTTPSLCCEKQQTVFLADATTETSHRIGHVVNPMILTASFYGAALYFGADRKHARWIAVGLSVTAIIGKELYDHHSAARSFSTEDVAFGLVGTAAGIWAAEKIPWTLNAR